MADLNLDYYDYANIFTTYFDKDGFEFFNLMNSVTINGEIDPSLYFYVNAHSFTDVYNLSKKHYGTHKLWWLILVANDIKNPFDIKSGQRLKILTNSAASEILSQINNS